MIYLDNPNRKMQIVLAGAVAANQLECTACFFDYMPQATTTVRRGGTAVTSSNSTTDVDIVAAPVLQGIVRNVHTVIIYNKDTAAATVTIKIDESGTETILVKQTLAAGESMMYEDQRGWHGVDVVSLPITDTTEIVKGSADPSKRIRFEVDGLSTGQTRVITVPDANVDLTYSRQASDTEPGAIEYAVQAEMEAGSVTDRAVTPGRQHFHPSASKGWVRFANDGSVNASYNVTSVTDTNPGDWTVNWANDFSTANYQINVTACGDAGAYVGGHGIPAAGTLRVWCTNGGDGTLTDPTVGMSVAAFGDQ